MIFNTNRTTSLGDIDVEVNESYLGAGSLYFMQENAEIEMELFESAVKSDIDECLIGESASELEALNENFVKNAANKIKEMMTKFIEWIKAISKSALAKLAQFIVTDNAKFVRIAEKRIITMKDTKDFKYTGLVIKDPKKVNMEKITGVTDALKKAWAAAGGDGATVEATKATIADLKKKLLEDNTADPNFEKVENKGFDIVQGHVDFLKKASREQIKEIDKSCKEFMKFANDIIKESAKKEKENKDDAKKEQLAAMSVSAAGIKEIGQTIINKELALLKKLVKVARAVVTKAMGATPKNEGFEYTEELIDAMIETANYELDDMLEEMSEGSDCEECKESDDDDDTDEDIDDEE